MDAIVGIFFVLYARSCSPVCIQEIPRPFRTRAECEVAEAKWTQKSVSFSLFTYGHVNGGNCLEKRLIQREIDAYGGISE